MKTTFTSKFDDGSDWAGTLYIQALTHPERKRLKKMIQKLFPDADLPSLTLANRAWKNRQHSYQFATVLVFSLRETKVIKLAEEKMIQVSCGDDKIRFSNISRVTVIHDLGQGVFEGMTLIGESAVATFHKWEQGEETETREEDTGVPLFSKPPNQSWMTVCKELRDKALEFDPPYGIGTEVNPYDGKGYRVKKLPGLVSPLGFDTPLTFDVEASTPKRLKEEIAYLHSLSKVEIGSLYPSKKRKRTTDSE